MGTLYYSIIFITLSIRTLVWLFLNKAFLQKGLKKMRTVYTPQLYQPLRIRLFFFFHHFSPSSSSNKPSSHPNHIMYCKYAKTLRAQFPSACKHSTPISGEAAHAFQGENGLWNAWEKEQSSNSCVLGWKIEPTLLICTSMPKKKCWCTGHKCRWSKLIRISVV